MKTMRIIVVLSIFLFLGCTGTVHVSSKADTIYPPHCTIAVSCNSDDPLSIQQKLEHLLASKGFNVVPERAAKIKANMQNEEHMTVESAKGNTAGKDQKKCAQYISCILVMSTIRCVL